LIKLIEEEDYMSMEDPGSAIKKEYKVNHMGVIKSPGKFEGEMYYVPYFYAVGMDGAADEDNGTDWLFNLEPDDYKKFPELKGNKTLVLHGSDQGFVSAELDGELPEPEEEPEDESEEVRG
jgi:hypothetical protein